MAALPERYLFCELDSVTLKGKRFPVAVYEAIAPIETATPEQRDYVTRYQAALHCYRAGDTSRAAELWLELAAVSQRGAGISPASVMAQRARAGQAIVSTVGGNA